MEDKIAPLATIEELAAILRMTPRGAERVLRLGGVPLAKRFGKRWLIPRHVLIAISEGKS